MKVSFIIPVYKVENYLDECVRSIVSQTYRNIEVILVDDGSPDNSPAMCDEWAKKDGRIKALHKLNGGLSDARNYGLQHALGDYVVFVDSDDFWQHRDDLQKLIVVAEKNPQADFIGYNCHYYYPNSNKYVSWIEYTEELLTSISGDKAMQVLVESGTFPMSACSKLLKRSTLVDGNILFKKGQIAEDIPWFINLLEKSSKCLFVNEYIYAYRQNVAGSITSSGGERSFNSLLDIVKTELEKIDSRTFSKEARDALKSFLAYEVSILMASISVLRKSRQKSAREELRTLSWLLAYTKNPKVRMVYRVYKIFGFTITLWVLKAYEYYRQRKR